MMASIKKLPSGNYRARVCVGRDHEGKQIIRSVTRPGWKECRKAARELEKEAEEGKLLDVRNVRLSKWLDEFIKIHHNSYAPETRRLYGFYCKNWFKPFFGNMKVGQINEIHVKQFRNHLLEQLQPSTARRCFIVLKSVLKEALQDNSPARNVSPPTANRPKSKAPSTVEFESIWEASKGTGFEVMVLLAGWCGLRRGEIFALRSNDIDWGNGRITVDESATQDGREIVAKTPKSANSYRSEVVPPYILSLLKQVIREKKVVALGNDFFLFEGNLNVFSQKWINFVRRNNLPKYTFHDLRHFHATWLYENDIPDLYAAKRLGHSVRTLKDVYQHLGLERQKEIEERILQMQNPSQ